MYTQANRPITVTTPLGKDALLLTGFTFEEGISQLFRGQLDMISEKGDVPFDKLIGQKVTITQELPNRKKRYFSGICNALWEGGQDATFTHYRMEMVPQFWLLTRRKGCRIFQHLTVPHILKKVLEGLNVQYEITGAFHPRDYCVQYRETDFDFVSRLMEEEGIYYFFKHTADGHQLVVANTPSSHPKLPELNPVVYGQLTAVRGDEVRVTHWEKGQQLRSGKYTLWDDCFELPHSHLEAAKTIGESVKVGAVTHKLRLAGNDRLEIYDYPGGYAQRFDGVDRGGRDRPAELKKVFEDNQRTVEIRMQGEALPSVEIRGAGTCPHFSSGHKFTLTRHFNADGEYVLTRVEHVAKLGANYRSGADSEFHYQTEFTCIPFALPYRPPQATRKPVIEGLQTARVVGPPGEEIFTDKYGRVKVQFPWDREGKKDSDSSCWLRVSQSAAGKGFGALSLPRVGQEVVVGFLEGDPDQPLVLGSVYNAENMPPYPLPYFRNYTGMRHQSVGGVPGNASEIRFETGLGQEALFMHAETDLHQHAENDSHFQVGNDHRALVGNDHVQQVGKDHHHQVAHNYVLTVGSGFSWDTGNGEGGSGGTGNSGAGGSGMGGGDAPAPSISGDQPPAPGHLDDKDWYSATRSRAPQDWGIGTFQINASNILTLAKYMDNKVVLGLETLAVVGLNLTLTCPANMEFNVGEKLESSLDHTDLSEDHCFAAKAMVNMASMVGMTLNVGPATIVMTPASITLTCGPSSIALTPAGITLLGALNTLT